jgi:hypothetical protein
MPAPVGRATDPAVQPMATDRTDWRSGDSLRAGDLVAAVSAIYATINGGDMSKKAEPKAREEELPAPLNDSDKARLTVMPSVNAAAVMMAYPNGLVGAEVDLAALIDCLHDCCANVKKDDLSGLEAMLTNQALALQAVFSNLARRAQTQNHPRQFEALLALALKAQAQSRATIQALVELKYPRQTAFVKQANISHGPQQVNNGDAGRKDRARGKKQIAQNKLLEDKTDGGTYLDAGTATATGRRDTALETVGKLDGAKKRGG